MTDEKELKELAVEADALVEQTGLPTVTAPDVLSLKEANGLAKVFHESGLFRDTKSLAQATVKVLAGYELGIGPFAAMRGINIIQGQLAPNAAITASLIKKDAKYNYIVETNTNEKCVITFYELFGDEWKAIGTNEWSLEDAERAGLTGKDNWRKYPRDMLFARTLTQGARQHCPHIFMGSVYTPEELGDVAPPTIIDSSYVETNGVTREDYRALVDKYGIDDEHALDILKESNNDFGVAYKAIEKQYADFPE